MAFCRPALQAQGRHSRVAMNSAELQGIFRPPVNRSMRVLDRDFFYKTLPIAAATVFDNRNLSTVRAKVQSAGDLLSVFSIKAVLPDEIVQGRKCVLLRPGILVTGLSYGCCTCIFRLSSHIVTDPQTWSPTITELVEHKIVGLRPYDLKLTYEDWTMRT